MQVWFFLSLHRLEIPQALRYEGRFFFGQAKPEVERWGGFLPIPFTGSVSTAFFYELKNPISG